MLRNRFLNGERVIEPVSIQSSRKYHMSEMDCLPDKYKNIHKDVPYPVKTLLPDQADPG